MASPKIVSGQLVNAALADFSGMRVEATYLATVAGVDAPARQSVPASANGHFSFELPTDGEWKAPLALAVTGGSGRVLGDLKDLKAEDPGLANLSIAVAEDIAPTQVTPSGDPTLGATARFTGRVIDSRGNPQRAGLLVVLWGRAPAAAAARPIAIADTVTGGYFAGEWPADVLTEAFAKVAGTDPIPVPLDGDRLPRRIVLVVDRVPDADAAAKDPPRAPTAEELAAQPEAFGDDAGCCQTFTTPNRTVEEVVFHAVVRTTQPEIQGAGVRKATVVPQMIVTKIVSLTRMQPLMLDALVESPQDGTMNTLRSAQLDSRVGSAPRNAVEAVRRGAALMSAASDTTLAAAAELRSTGVALGIAERAQLILERRDAQSQPLRLESSVLAEMAREPGEITAARLLTAERTSLVRNFRNQLFALDPKPVGRFDLSVSHQADWDSPPLPYQATTIAHGHLISMKQVWRADGYSLGDVLYSLPLAPGQQKLVSILDWERREATQRTEHRVTTEDVSAGLSHDRDISDIIRTALHERMDASSRANTSAVGTAIGGFIGPVVFGAAGGTSSASSSAQQASARDIAASALNQARDRTLQSASAVRGQRASVVQTARQGESVRAQTEAIANNNHCHALTIEYFEVLRHFQVSQEIAQVQECLFVPFAITLFNDQKALRWRHVLQDMTIYHGGSVMALRSYFDALDRKVDNWAHVDYPVARYADDVLRDLSGELWLTMSIPRPADTIPDNLYDKNTWTPYAALLGVTTEPEVHDIWNRYMGVALPQDRPAVWNSRLAPAIARRLADNITVDLFEEGVGFVAVGTLDATLVSRFGQDAPLLVTFRATTALPNITRAQVSRVRFRFGSLSLPTQVETVVQSGSLRYRTDHLARAFFEGMRIQNDLGQTDFVEMATPLDRMEKNNPRFTDRRNSRLLIDILNERLEYFHRIIWLTMDANRRYMFLDGIIAPNAAGRSVASVVDNRVIGIVGNSLVMPVVPGMKLDPTYEFARRTPQDLKNLYAVDPPPPMRISMPTRGVFAEAVMGKCNSCEKIDDRRFWHWEDAPIPDSPTAILPLSTASRRETPPSVAPGDFPDALVRMQATPSAPDPTGLSAALSLLGTKDLFRNLTGLALNQENAAAALKSVMSAAQSFASQGAALAQQKFLSSQMDRNLDLIKQARDRKQITPEQAQGMSESMFRGALGERRPESAPVTDNTAVKRAMDRVSSSESGEIRITRPGGTVEMKTGNKAVADGLNIEVDPKIDPLKQPTSMTCWAAAGTMLKAWKTRVSMTIPAALDSLGGSWRAKFEADQGLSGSETHAFAQALGLTEDGPMSYSIEGLARLLKGKGPIWVITDDDFEANKVIHARIITAMHGDGTIDGTTLTLADPLSGRFVTEPFSKFEQRLEAPEVVGAGVGVFHW
ncbi:MAG: papain-like cysteine protease family protein [Terriglobales bacterium]